MSLFEALIEMSTSPAPSTTSYFWLSQVFAGALSKCLVCLQDSTHRLSWLSSTDLGLLGHTAYTYPAEWRERLLGPEER